jgi:tripartite-type tricarboxylate transporter receptor subunit TctC
MEARVYTSMGCFVMKRFRLGCLILTMMLTSLLWVSPSLSQSNWPNKAITIIVPYSAGGSLDTTTRVVAARLSERLGQSVLVENVTGAGGSVGILKAIQASADGHTLLMAGDAPLNTSNTPGAPIYKHDMLKDLIPIALVNTAPMVLVAHPSLKANSLGELMTLAREKPGKLNYASSGIGTIPHLATEMIKQQSRTHMVHIPYRGGTQIANDVVGNQIDLAMLINASAAPYIKAKSIKPIAVTSEKRLALMPDVPAISETPGFAGFNVVSWAGLYAPANTNPSVTARLNKELDEILKSDAIRQRLSELGAVAGGGSSSQFVQFIEDDRARFIKILKTVSIKE